VHEI